MRILLANPRGFCAGVDRAIDIVERAIELFGAPIHVRHEVVHNRFVVERLRGRKRAKDEIEDQIKEEAGERFEDIVFPENGNQKDTPDSDSYYKDIGQEDLNEEVDDIYKYK